MERMSQRVMSKEAELHNSVRNSLPAIYRALANKKEKMKSEQVIESRKEACQ